VLHSERGERCFAHLKQDNYQKEFTIKEFDESPQQNQRKMAERSACKTFPRFGCVKNPSLHAPFQKEKSVVHFYYYLYCTITEDKLIDLNFTT
jgi:hypothetical protein